MGTTRELRTTNLEQAKCESCAFKHAAHLAQCPKCFAWRSLVPAYSADDGVVSLSDATIREVERYPTGAADPCFGGGLARASTILLAGEAGAGKSTLSLQIADALCTYTGRPVLYAAVEENLAQVKDRSVRLAIVRRDLIQILPMTHIHNLSRAIMTRKPCAVFVDSLSKLVGKNLDQGTEFLERAKEYAVELNAPFIALNHVTKDGEFAGLEAWKHTVDTAIRFTVFGNVRVLTTEKNRNGEAYVSVYFDMTAKGLIPKTPCEVCNKIGCEHQLEGEGEE